MGKIAFIFPGQGSQSVGMGRDLFDRFAAAREVWEEADRALGFSISHISFEGPVEELGRTEITQPALLAAGMAAFRVLASEAGISPDIAAGHSLGEYTALCAAGSFPLANAIRLTRERGRLMQSAVPPGKGLMAAVLGLERAAVEDTLGRVTTGYVGVANYNCPGQLVISGEKPAVEEAAALLKAAGAKRVLPLAVSAPSHCMLMKDAAVLLSGEINKLTLADPAFPVMGNADAVYMTRSVEIPPALEKQLWKPLYWEDSIRRMATDGVDTFIEVGPGKVLSGLVKRILPETRVLNVEDSASLEKTKEAIGSAAE